MVVPKVGDGAPFGIYEVMAQGLQQVRLNF